MLDIDVAGLAIVSEGGIEIERAPDGITFEPLASTSGSARSSAPTTSSPPTTRRAGSTACSSASRRASSSSSRSMCGSRTPRRTVALLAAARRRRGGLALQLIEEYASASPDLAAYSNAAVELFVEQGAKLEYVSLQNLSRGTWHFATHHAQVERDAELDWVAAGSARGREDPIQNDLAGRARPRAWPARLRRWRRSTSTTTPSGARRPEHDLRLRVQGARCATRATTVWRGMIRVEQEAQRRRLPGEAKPAPLRTRRTSDSIPGLEILANDVRCTHGATLGQVDREQLFYLMSRGLSRPEAERLIVRGFFQDVLDRIELEPVREALADALEARIPQTSGSVHDVGTRPSDDRDRRLRGAGRQRG